MNNNTVCLCGSPGQSPDVGRVCDAGQRLMVVGGGLTSAHIVSIALEQGASHVTWVMRKHLQVGTGISPTTH